MLICIILILISAQTHQNKLPDNLIDVFGTKSKPSFIPTATPDSNPDNDYYDDNNEIDNAEQVDSGYLGCGYSNPGGFDVLRINMATKRVEKAQYAAFPWMVAVLKNTPLEEFRWVTDYIGGGSLIHWSVVLTAAHKVQGRQPTDIKIRAGEWDTQNDDELYKFQEVGVKDIVLHEKFRKKWIRNNVALLFLKRPIVKDSHVDLACLGSSLPPAGTTCYSMGWGKDRPGDQGKYADILKKVEVPLVSREECEKKHRTDRLVRSFRLHPSLVCAGGIKEVDTCQGDGGSPLVCALDGGRYRYALYGGVSGGTGCGSELPAFYTNYVLFKDWIVKKVTDEGLDAKIFTLDE